MQKKPSTASPEESAVVTLRSTMTHLNHLGEIPSNNNNICEQTNQRYESEKEDKKALFFEDIKLEQIVLFVIQFVAKLNI